MRTMQIIHTMRCVLKIEATDYLSNVMMPITYFDRAMMKVLLGDVGKLYGDVGKMLTD